MFKPINIKEYFKIEIDKLKSFAQAHSFKLGIIDATDDHDIGNQIYIKKKIEDFEAVGWNTAIHKTNNVREGGRAGSARDYCAVAGSRRR